MILSNRTSAISYANATGNPAFFISYFESGFLNEEYWVEDRNAEKGVFSRSLALFASEHLDNRTFNSLERL